MLVFGTPDFGASGGIMCVLMIVWAIVLAVVLAGLVWGIKLLASDFPKVTKCGALLLLVSGLAPFCCCLGPPHAVRTIYGNYPLGGYPNNKIKEGMSTDEVRAILGSPHERSTQGDEESWYYWIDSFAIHWFCVRFGPEGRVVGTHGN